MKCLLVFACAAVCFAQVPPTFEIRVGDETVPDGAFVQLKMSLTDPHPISTGKIRPKLFDPILFGDVIGIALFSDLGDVAGAALVQGDAVSGRQVSAQFILDPRFTSVTNPTFGMNPDYPIMTVVVGTNANAPVRTVTVDLDMGQSFWANLLGVNYAGAISKPGTITVGGTLSINNVVPGGGTVRAGTVVRVLGTGFTSSTKVSMEDPKPSSVVFKSAQEIDLTFGADIDLQGKGITVSNNSPKEQVTYFSYLRATPFGTSSRKLLQQTVPIFAKALPGGFLPTSSTGSYNGLALQNATSSSVNVKLDLLSAGGQVLASVSIQLPGGQRYVREVSELFPAGTAIPSGGSVRVTPDTPIQMLGIVADDSAGTVTPLNLSSAAQTTSLTASAASLQFNYQTGGTLPASQPISLTSAAALSFSVTQSPPASWLTVSSATGTTPASLSITANPVGLAPGTYTTNLQIAPASGAAIVIPVSLIVTSVSVPSIAATVNAATQQTGAVSPGEIITLYGNFPGVTPTGLALDANGKVATSLSGMRILFDGVAAPLTFVSSTQINAVVPYEIGDGAPTHVQVESASVLSGAVTQATAASAPAIFTADSSGGGPAAALNQDLSLNTAKTPAARGSVIILYGTGEGRTSPPGVTGSVTGADLKSPVLDVSATIGGQPAIVKYAGSAPGLVAGVLQVNLLVPDTAPSGLPAPVILKIGNNSSRPDVTVWIQ